MNVRPPTDGRWATEPRQLHVGQQVTLDDRNVWTVKAVTEHFAALTRPVTGADRAEQEEYGIAGVELEGNVLYTVLDWRNGYRGPCNLIGQAWGDGLYTEAECAEMLAEFEAGDLEISHRNWTRFEVAA